jgi:hypothetical protein
MASSNDTNQGGRNDQEQGGGGKPKNDPKVDGAAAADYAKAKKGGARHQQRSGNNHHYRNNSNEDDKSKRRRRNNSRPRRYIIIPEARVIQEYNECAYISESEVNEREYLPTAVRRGGGAVTDRLRQEVRQQDQMKNKEVKNDALASSKFAFAGRHRKRHGKCHCFDCWY